jgi:hypothetical protein
MWRTLQLAEVHFFTTKHSPAEAGATTPKPSNRKTRTLREKLGHFAVVQNGAQGFS